MVYFNRRTEENGEKGARKQQYWHLIHET